MSSKDKEMFSFEISLELKEKLRKYAYENKLTLSKSVRTILEEFFEVSINVESKK